MVNLFHSEGVVFGEGMIDAHRLENRVAIYPRVVLSSRILSKLDGNLPSRLLRDFDGIWHLNYFTQMTSNVDANDRNKWRAACEAMINQNIHDLGTRDKWNEFAKWSWFREKFASHVQ